MGRPSPALRTLAGAFLLSLLLPLAAAHGDDEKKNMNMDMGMSIPEPVATPVPADSFVPNYFAHSEHRGLMYAHISLMTLSWMFVLPVGKLHNHAVASQLPQHQAGADRACLSQVSSSQLRAPASP
jgi:hypothetical protein